MAMSYAIRRLRLIGRKFGRRDPLDERVRRTLVQSLYTQPVSMAIGLLVGVVSSGIAALPAAWRRSTERIRATSSLPEYGFVT